MESKSTKFRLRLNLFDCVILALALIAAAVLAWVAMRPTPASEIESVPGTVRYTVRFNRWPQGTSGLIQLGDRMIDNTKDREMGEVVDIQVFPARMMVLNQAERRQALAPIEGYEEIVLTIEAPCDISRYSVKLDEGSYTLRVGGTAYLRGEGYMGSGAIESIEIVETFEDGQEVEQ